MLPNPDPARVVDRIRQRPRNGSDGRLRKTFGSKEPTGLQTINTRSLMGCLIRGKFIECITGRCTLFAPQFANLRGLQ